MPILISEKTKPNFKTVLIIFFLLLTSAFYFLQFSQVKGQTEYETAKENYSNQLKKYNEAQDIYLTKKANYETFQTATAKNEAFEATKIYLIEANFLIAEKLRQIKTYGSGLDWNKANYSKDETLILIDEELAFLEQNWHDVQNTTALEQLPPLGTILKERLEWEIRYKVDLNLGTFEVVKMENTYLQFKDIAREIKDFASPRATNENQSIINNWDSEVDNIDRAVSFIIQSAKRDLEATNVEFRVSHIEGIKEKSRSANSEFGKAYLLFEEILRII